MTKKKKTINILGIVISMSISLALVLIAARIWELDLNVPPSIHDDGMLGMTLITSIKESGLKGYLFCERLGAPEVSQFIDTPFLDMNYVLETYVLTKILPSSAAVYHAFYLLTFPLACFTMYLLISRLTKSIWVRSFFSIAFAITPYHFMRGVGHMTLANCYVVPVAVYLSMLIAEEEFRGIIPERYCKNKWKTMIMFFACLVLGLGNIYYVFFGLLCMATALLTKMIRKKRLSCLWKEAVLIYGVLLSAFLGLLPKIIYSLINGVNKSAGTRMPMESEIYALKIIQLLLPCEYNRIGFLSKLNASYATRAFNINENTKASLGFLATIGFLIACVWIVYLIIGRVKITNPSDKKELFEIDESDNFRLSFFSLTILTIVLFSVPGGFGTVVSYFITPEIRCFNRSSIFIACLSLCVFVIILKFVNKKFTYKKYSMCITLIGILTGAFVVYSEIPHTVSGYQETAKQENKVLTNFFAEVENSLQKNDMVYELPFMSFPEAGAINKINDYEPAFGYIYTDNIRWSYGGMKGRNTTAESYNVTEGMSMYFLNRIIKAGYAGVYIDTYGYTDGGAAIIAFYSDSLGLEPIVSEDGRLYFYKLDNIEIDDRLLVAGYGFIDIYDGVTGAKADVDKKSRLAKGLFVLDETTMTELFGWAEDAGLISDEMTDSEYVSWLYKTILSRESGVDENTNLANAITNKTITRYDAFVSFFASEEFRNKNGLNDEQRIN